MKPVATFGETPAGFHGEGIHAVAFDSSGRWLLVASPSSLCLWTASSLERVGRLSGGPCHGGVGFAGDLAVALIDTQLRFWRVPGGEPAGELDVEADGNGRYRALVGVAGLAAIPVRESREIVVWDLASREVRARVAQPPGPLLSVLSLSLDGTRLLAANEEAAELWDVASGKALARVARGGMRDGEMLLTAGGANALVVRRVDRSGTPTSFGGRDSLTTLDEISLEKNGALVRRLIRPGRFALGPIAVRENPACVVAATNSGFTVWRDGGPLRHDDRKGEHRVWGRCAAIALSPDASVAVTADTDGWLTRWDTATLERLDHKPQVLRGRRGQPDGSAMAITGLAVSPDGRFVLAVDERGTGVCRDIAGGVVVGRAPVGARIMEVASAGDAAFATLHDARDERPPYAGGFVCRLWSHALAPIGELRISHVSALGPGTLAHAIGERVDVLALPELDVRASVELAAAPSALALSRDGSLLGWAAPEPPDRYRQIVCTVGTRRLATGTPVHEYRIGHAQEYPIQTLSISPDGALAAARTTFVAMHDLAGRRLHPRSHDSLFRAFGPEAHVLAVGEDSPSLYVWDFAGDERRQTHELAHASRVRSVAWISATRVVTGCEDGTIAVWDL